MKKLLPMLALIMSFCLSSFSQNAETKETKPTKTSQASLYNDFYGGYGALSIFYFTGRMLHNDDYPTETNAFQDKKFLEPTSAGNFFLGYQRSLNRVVSVGFVFAFQNFHYTGTAHLRSNGNDSLLRIINDDRLVTGIARITFTYLSKPYIRMYSGIGLGLTIDFGKATVNGEPTTERKLWPGGELTLMGLRVGRAFGGFLEFGFGSYGIVNAGLSYKFAD